MPRFAVIGLGRFGHKLAQLLTKAGAEVVGIDLDPDIVQRDRDEMTLVLRMDSTDQQALIAQGIDKVDAAVVGIGTDFEANILTVTTLKQIGVPRVVARAGSGVQGRILERVGADDVVYPEDESAARWANSLMMPQFESFIELDSKHNLVQVPAPQAFVYKTLRELELRPKYKLNLVAIRRLESPDSKPGEAERWKFIAVVDPDEPIEPGDVLVLIGSNESLARLPKE
ncbi:MAG: TrkA family potassium uptake protein [Phycisphaerae bacterium]|nr:TrkA family potassium uptake protein [Phycisphaerae bacterium]